MFVDLKYLIWDMYYLTIDASPQILEKWKLKKWFPDTRLLNFCYSALRMRVTHHSNLKSCINSFVIDEPIIESYFISKKFTFDWIIWKVISVNDTILILSKHFVKTLVMHMKGMYIAFISNDSLLRSLIE